jgi:hypothetical protein
MNTIYLLFLIAPFGFSWRWPFGAKTPVYDGCKSLDFLGFSRPNLAFSMGYAGFSEKKILRALLLATGRHRDGVNGL